MDYSQHTHTVDQALDYIRKQLLEIQEPFHLVGHSMGGLLCLSLAANTNIRSISTIATPLGGLEFDFWQYWLTRDQLIHDLYYFSPLIKRIHKSKYMQPVQHLISTKGHNPFLFKPSDGVVSLSSQRAWKAGKIHEIASNHAEVMLNPQTSKILNSFWINN